MAEEKTNGRWSWLRDRALLFAFIGALTGIIGVSIAFVDAGRSLIIDRRDINASATQEARDATRSAREATVAARDATRSVLEVKNYELRVTQVFVSEEQERFNREQLATYNAIAINAKSAETATAAERRILELTATLDSLSATIENGKATLDASTRRSPFSTPTQRPYTPTRFVTPRPSPLPTRTATLYSPSEMTPSSGQSTPVVVTYTPTPAPLPQTATFTPAPTSPGPTPTPAPPDPGASPTLAPPDPGASPTLAPADPGATATLASP